MRLAVVANPVGAAEQVDDLKAALGKRQVDADWYETSEADPGTDCTRMALESGAEVVMAVGGDGTVRACAEAVVDTDAALAVVPAGTGNLLARNFAIPEEAAACLDLALSGPRIRIDTGEVNGETFTVMAGAGLDALIMDGTTRDAKDRLGVLAYVAQALQHVFDEPIQARVTIDGGDVTEGSFATILVGNLGRLQGGVDLFPDASPGDGVLDVLGLSSESPLQTITAGVAAAVGSNGSQRLLRSSGRRVELEFPIAVPYELDGDPRPSMRHLAFRVKPRSLTICAEGTDE